MFMGEFNHTIDAKGRTFVPAKMRDDLGESFVVTQGLDGCLVGYPQEEWKVFEEKITSLPLSNKAARTTTRFFLSGASTCEVDKQGRILLPAKLRAYAGLEKDIVFIGTGNKIEIWDKAKWDAACEECDNMEEVIENMESLGFIL